MTQNKVYSYSRLSTFEACPRQYRYRYIEKADPLPDPSPSPRRIGTAVHAVAEDLVRGHVSDGKRGMLALAEIPELLRHHWQKQELPGEVASFADALSWLRRWAQSEEVLDYRSVLGLEKKFEITIKGVPVIGYLDRVSKVDDRTVEVLDYKTGASLFDRAELEHGLQLSIYALAASELYQWAPSIRLVYSMLRHGIRQVATRTPAQLEAAGHYIAAVAAVITASTRTDCWPANINPHCGFCDYRDRCECYCTAFGDSLDTTTPTTVEAACRERVAMHSLEKAAAKRKREAESVIRVALKRMPEIRAAGSIWTYYNQARTDYSVPAVLATLASASGLTAAEVAGRVCKISKTALTGFVEGLELDQGQTMGLIEELEALGEVKVSPRLHVRSGRQA